MADVMARSIAGNTHQLAGNSWCSTFLMAALWQRKRRMQVLIRDTASLHRLGNAGEYSR